MKLNGEEKRGFKKEKLIEHFFYVFIIGHMKILKFK